MINSKFFATLLALQFSERFGDDMNSIYGNAHFVSAKAGDHAGTANSTAFRVGVVKFPMYSFGVQDPCLKSKVDVPEMSAVRSSDVVYEQPLLFGGARAKAVHTEGEQSTVGLPTISGLSPCEVPTNTDASCAELLVGSAITKALVDGKALVIRSVVDRNAAETKQAETGRAMLVLAVMQNRVDATLTIVLKEN